LVSNTNQKNKKNIRNNIISLFRKILIVFLVTIISFIVHIPNLKTPNDVLFEESSTGKFINDFLQQKRTFDINPPLAKMLISYYAKYVCNYKGKFPFNINTKYIESSDIDYIKMRAFTCICGSLVPTILTSAMLAMDCSLMSSFITGVLFALDFMEISQSRMLVVDPILYLFVALTIFFSAFYKRNGSCVALILEMVSAACALCSKFTGVVAVIYSLVSMFFISARKKGIEAIARRIIIAIISFLGTVTGIMYLFLTSTPQTGTADKYVYYDFRKKPMVVQCFSLLRTMLKYNYMQVSSDPYVSDFYKWPFFISAPSIVWSQNFNMEIIALFNNPVTGLLAFIGALLCICNGRFDWTASFFAIIPFVQMKKFQRQMFYEVPLIFGICALSFGLDYLPKILRKIVCSFTIICAIASFFFWMPWIYGINMSKERILSTLVWKELRDILKIQVH
jgi:dolichyl-phosphate-mannose-protein mannosyltransferase